MKIDETPVYLDTNRYKTYEKIGKREVVGMKTSNFKSRFTASLEVTSNGINLQSLLIYKNRSKIKYFFETDILTINNNKGWISLDNLTHWFDQRIFKRREESFDCLPIDKFTVHTTSEFLSNLDGKNLPYFLIP